MMVTAMKAVKFCILLISAEMQENLPKVASIEE